MSTRSKSDSPLKEVKRQESSSFLKKRTKKLFSVAGGTDSTHVGPLLRTKVKSFLLLFFKKEVLPFPVCREETHVPRRNHRNHPAHQSLWSGDGHATMGFVRS